MEDSHLKEPMSFEDVVKMPSMSLFMHGRRGLPEISAVYFMWSVKYGLLYVGATQCLRKRFYGHHHGILLNVASMRVSWLPCELGSLAETESRLIRRFDPPMNIAVKKGQRRLERLGSKFFGLGQYGYIKRRAEVPAQRTLHPGWLVTLRQIPSISDDDWKRLLQEERQ